MKIEIEEPLAQGFAAHPRDVRRVKQVLICRGYYVPDPRTGVTGEAGEGFWTGLKAFQRAHMIPFTDIAGPGSITERVMNDELAVLEKENGLYTWRTAGDDKVRNEHAARAGRRFFFGEPPEGGHPGEDYNCRCWAEPLNPSRHILAEEARRAQMDLWLNRDEPFGFERNGQSAKENAPLDPMADAIHATLGPFDLLAGTAIARAGGGAILSVITRAQSGRPQTEQPQPKLNSDDPVFKRPEGVPDDWKAEPVNKGEGVIYKHPNEKGATYVKVQKGMSKSSNPGQQYDNVRWQKNGKSLNINGDHVERGSQDSHIPIKDFKFDLEKMK